ncbi:MAG: bacterioferritin [Bryobacterales bacterium]|nr:bacterioferritin [Bryobacterales bacterium]MDE0628317.1 bacterioferritin [Bryobacterales bacterium]
MKGNPNVLTSLRQLLKYELTAINQSFLHARMCLDWGYEGIAHAIRKASIRNMVFAEQLVDRILFLEGMPNLRDTYHLRIGTDVGQIHARDRKLARDTANCANAGIDVCVKHEDDASRELLESILADEELRIDWLESQLQIISDAGLGLYLSQQMRR